MNVLNFELKNKLSTFTKFKLFYNFTNNFWKTFELLIFKTMNILKKGLEYVSIVEEEKLMLKTSYPLQYVCHVWDHEI